MGRKPKTAAPPEPDSDQDDTPAFTGEEDPRNAEPDGEGKIPLSAAKARGALTTDAMARNKKNKRTVQRKLKGEKNIQWDENGPVLYALISETHGLEKVKIHIEKTQPEHAERGLHMLVNIPEYESLTKLIVDNFWDGKKCVYKWTALKSGSQRLGSDTIEFDDDPVAQQKWAAKLAQPSQQTQAAASGQMGNGQQPQVVLQQTAPPPQSMPMEQVNFFLSRLERMENRLDASVNKRTDEEEEEEDDPDEPEIFRPRTQPQPGFSQAHEEPMGSYPRPAPAPAQQDQWEQVLTPAGTIAYVKKVVAVKPPPNLPEPPPGYAWQITPGGAWTAVQIGEQHAAPQAQRQAPVVQAPVPIAEPVQATGMSSQERDLLEQKHQLEMELAVTKERYKMMGDLNKVRQEVAMMTQPGQLAPAPQQQQQQPAMVPQGQQSGVLPTPPTGYAWQALPGGGVAAIPLAAVGMTAPQAQAAPAAPAPAPQTPAEQVRSLTDTLKSVSGLMTMTSNIFPKGEGSAHGGPGASAEPAVVDDGLPLTKIDAGGWQMWFDKETRKPVDAATQIAMNLGNIREAGKGIITEALDGYRKIVEQQNDGKSAKLEKDRQEMAAHIRRQKEQLDETNRRLEQIQRGQQHQHPYVVEEVEDEPEPAPPPPEPSPSSSIAAGAMSAFARHK